jgi:hypothetical protein
VSPESRGKDAILRLPRSVRIQPKSPTTGLASDAGSDNSKTISEGRLERLQT